MQGKNSPWTLLYPTFKICRASLAKTLHTVFNLMLKEWTWNLLINKMEKRYDALNFTNLFSYAVWISIWRQLKTHPIFSRSGVASITEISQFAVWQIRGPFKYYVTRWPPPPLRNAPYHFSVAHPSFLKRYVTPKCPLLPRSYYVLSLSTNKLLK